MPLPSSAGTQTTSGSNQPLGHVGDGRGGGRGGSSGGGGSSPSLGTVARPAPVLGTKTTSSDSGLADVLQSIAALVSESTTDRDESGFDLNRVDTAESVLASAKEESEAPRYGGYIQAPANTYQPYSTAEPAPTPEDKVAAANSELYQARRDERRHAIGADVQGPYQTGKPAPGAGEVKQMTQEQYDALSDKERAAVDFNSMLVKAVRRDTKMADTYNPSPDEKTTYDAAINRIFGEDGGSEIIAPETVAVLNQIGFEDKTADLDDFLNLTAAINQKDLKDLKQVAGPTIGESQMNSVELNNYSLNETLATSTLQMEEALVRGNQLLSDITRTALLDRQDRVDLLGGIPRTEARLADRDIVGFGGDEVSQYFQRGFEILANSENKGDQDQVLATMAAELSPSELNAFMQYADSRSGMATEYGIPLGGAEGVKYRTPEQFRTMLGLDKEADDARS